MVRTLKFSAYFFAIAAFTALALPAHAAVRSLSSGMTGSDVAALQQALIDAGYLAPGSAVGHFGPATLAAVKKFQCAKGIVCSGSSYGLVGPLTRAALFGASAVSTAPAAQVASDNSAVSRSLAIGMSGADVTEAQQALIDQGYLAAGSATGYFGPLTRAAVRKFQCASGIICSGSAYGTVGPATRAALGLGGMEVTGWIPYWRKDKGVADVIPHIAQFTTLMPFGYTVLSDGSVYDAMNWGVAPWTTLVAAARANHVKIIPTVMWSNGAAIDAVLSDPAMRASHEDQIVNLVTDNNYDGIDIDYEGKYASTKDAFSTYLRELKAKLGSRLLYCTIEARTPVNELYDGTPPPDATTYANDLTAINKYCDRVQLMTYDQETADVALNKAASSSPYIPVADPRWVASVIKLVSQSVSKSKLMVGVATYGYEWEVTPLAQSGFRYDLQWAFDPDYATQIEQQFGVKAVRNAAGEMSIAYLPTMATTTPPDDSSTATTVSNNPNAVSSTTYSDGSTLPAIAPSFNILWWSDAQAVAQEISLARQYGLKGVAIFKLDGGEDQNVWQVLPKPAR